MTEIVIETGELTTNILPPKKELGIIIPITAKEAISLKDFFDMFYEGYLVPPREQSNIKVQISSDLNKSTLLERTFQPALKRHIGAVGLKNSPWSVWGYTDASGLSVGQLFDFSALGGVNSSRQDTSGLGDNAPEKILMAYSHDDAMFNEGDDGTFGGATFLAQVDVINYIQKETGIATCAWDLCSRMRIFDKLLNFQLGTTEGVVKNISISCARTIKSVDDAAAHYFKQKRITEIREPDGLQLGIGSKANMHLFVNVRLLFNLDKTNIIPDILLRIRYPIRLLEGEYFGGLTIKPFDYPSSP